MHESSTGLVAPGVVESRRISLYWKSGGRPINGQERKTIRRPLTLPLTTDLARLSRVLEPAPPKHAGLMPVLRPKLPAGREILPYLEAIDERQWYSNWGPLVTQLEAELRRHLGMETGGVVTTANGTAGLTAALLALDVPRGSFCLMPSWTFAATPHAAYAAGLRPWFHEVDRGTWALDADEVFGTVQGLQGRVGAVIVVSPFGAPIDTAAWESFREQTGIPVVIDAAAGFDSIRISALPTVVSLHATKILAAGEGGFVATTDEKLRDRVMACCNFGFQGSRSAVLSSLNAKMSEYHAAVGLASLASWADTRARHLQIAEWYRGGIGSLPNVELQPGYGTGWAAGTTSVVLPGRSAAPVASRMMDMGVETRFWWGHGCHVQPAFTDCPRGPLPVTEDLGRHVLGLPHFLEMRQRDVLTVVEALSEAVSGRASHRRVSA